MLHWRSFLPQVTVAIIKRHRKVSLQKVATLKESNMSVSQLYTSMKSDASILFPQHQMLHSKPHFAPSYVTKYLNKMIVIVSVTQSQIKLAY